MTRIGPSSRLNELLRIVGTRETDRKKADGQAGSGKARPSSGPSIESLKRELAREISGIDLDAESGRETAQRILIHKVIQTRFDKIQPNAAQISMLTRGVSEKAAQRKEVRDLLNDVIDEIVAEQ